MRSAVIIFSPLFFVCLFPSLGAMRDKLSEDRLVPAFSSQVGVSKAVFNADVERLASIFRSAVFAQANEVFEQHIVPPEGDSSRKLFLGNMHALNEDIRIRYDDNINVQALLVRYAQNMSIEGLAFYSALCVHFKHMATEDKEQGIRSVYEALRADCSSCTIS